MLTVPRCPHYTKCMFVRRRLTCSNGMRPTLQLTNPFSFLVEWPAACSRYPSTDTTTNHIRSPAALLKWPAARSRYPSTDTRRIPAKMAGMRLAHVTHVEVHVGFPDHMATTHQFSRCGLLMVPMCPHHTKCMFARRILTHMACGLLTVPIYRFSLAGLPAKMASGPACLRYSCAHTTRSACSHVAGFPAQTWPAAC